MSRATHTDAELHFGVDQDLYTLLSAIVGPLPAGSSLHDALAYLDSLLDADEASNFHGFGSLHADAIRKAAISAAFGGASITRASRSGSFTSNGAFSIPHSATFTGDAFVLGWLRLYAALRKAQGPFSTTLDAAVAFRTTGSWLADAIARRTVQPTLPVSASNTTSPSGNLNFVTGTSETVFPGCDLTVPTSLPVSLSWNVWVSQFAPGVHKYYTMRLRRTNTSGSILWSWSGEEITADSTSGHIAQFNSSYVDNAPTDGRYVFTFQSTASSSVSAYSDTRTFSATGATIGLRGDSVLLASQIHGLSGDSTIIYQRVVAAITALSVLGRSKSGTLSANAIPRLPRSGSLLADAIFGRGGQLTLRGITLRTTSATKTADAKLIRHTEAQLPADSVFLKHQGASTAYSAKVLALNPVHYWKLGEPSGATATDSGSSPVSATYSGATLGQANASNVDGTSVRLNGAARQLIVASGSGNPTGNNDRTIECWFRNSHADTRVVYGYGSGGGNGNFVVLFNYSGELGVSMYGNDRGVSAGGRSYDGNWHHFAVTWTGSSHLAEFWLDGTSYGTQNYGAINTGTSGGARIGELFYADGWGVWDGNISHVAVYASKLSNATIIDHAAGGTASSVLFTADSRMVWTTSASWTADAVLRARSFDAAAYVQSAVPGTMFWEFSADAVLAPSVFDAAFDPLVFG